MFYKVKSRKHITCIVNLNEKKTQLDTCGTNQIRLGKLSV